MERLLAKCDPTRYPPSAAQPDNNPPQLALPVDNAADQSLSISHFYGFLPFLLN